MIGKYNIELNNGDQKFTIKYTPAQLDIIVDGEIPLEEFKERMEYLYELCSEFILSYEEINSKETLIPFVKSLLNDERYLEQELAKIQEIIQIAKAFRNEITLQSNDECQDSRVKIEIL